MMSPPPNVMFLSVHARKCNAIRLARRVVLHCLALGCNSVSIESNAAFAPRYIFAYSRYKYCHTRNIGLVREIKSINVAGAFACEAVCYSA